MKKIKVSWMFASLFLGIVSASLSYLLPEFELSKRITSIMTNHILDKVYLSFYISMLLLSFQLLKERKKRLTTEIDRPHEGLLKKTFNIFSLVFLYLVGLMIGEMPFVTLETVMQRVSIAVLGVILVIGYVAIFAKGYNEIEEYQSSFFRKSAANPQILGLGVLICVLSGLVIDDKLHGIVLKLIG